MKIINRISGYFFSIFTFSAFIWLSACTALEENPKTFISSDQFYRNVVDAEAALTAVYYGLNYGGSSRGFTHTPYNILFISGQEFMADDVKMGPGAQHPDVKAQSTLDHSATTLRVREIWQQHYAAINKANIAIDNIPGILFNTPAEEALLKKYVLEAKFLRGLYYFNLVRLYGSVPLILHETTTLDNKALMVYRSPAEEVYEQIIKDFSEAASGLPWYIPQNSVDAGRANAASAEAFLSLVYLTLANVGLDDNLRAANVSVISDRNNLLEKSVEHARNIIDRTDRDYDLFDDYADVFRKTAKNGKEHLFSAQFSSVTSTNGNGLGPRTAAVGIPKLGGASADVPTEDLTGRFRDIDKRKAVMLTDSYEVDGVTYVINPQSHSNKYACYKYFDGDAPGLAQN
jgi:hypothetical protein